ncbi:CarD family transcriptional regulator [Rickettsiales endosymbiont of Peranema trichophorum]|uniref:CarD family transcriptional regulator n=1 Tax=Rickettsiales endosymbiont of Peranema trichophorum TaxID=2486577 RepID=UPI001022B238|nr:CarD family transcriptional regulator [Rickettsiales endosymbiont of Peranema trichophorum]RZI46008.1 CarD family transcriptional regulator [Rickettsiales endosymbiont of Peranema trichophorum]
MSLSFSKVFHVGDPVVYPSHGVGKIMAEETQTIAGTEMKMYVISFAKDKMILRVPQSRAIKTGLRHVRSTTEFQVVLDILSSKPRGIKGMWSKRAQEYENKINSGDVQLIAEVLRDLYKSVGVADRSYSETVIYESALDRLSQEYGVTMGLTKEEAREQILTTLDTAASEL